MQDNVLGICKTSNKIIQSHCMHEDIVVVIVQV